MTIRNPVLTDKVARFVILPSLFCHPFVKTACYLRDRLWFNSLPDHPEDTKPLVGLALTRGFVVRCRTGISILRYSLPQHRHSRRTPFVPYPMNTSSSLETAIQILGSARNIAVVGLSRSPGKPAHDIPLFLAARGYDVVGVNPFATPQVGDVHVVPSLDDVNIPIDILNVFRPSADTDAIIETAIIRHQQRGDISCIWLQQGITSTYGAQRCAEAGITYIEDTCIYVVHAYVRDMV